MILLVAACSNAVKPTEAPDVILLSTDTGDIDSTDDTGVKKSGRIVINEVLADNADGAVNEFGEHEDWLELYNAGEATVTLKDWTLTDTDSKTAWRIEPVQALAPGEHLLIWCDEEDGAGTIEHHAPFKLSRDGENLVLSDKSGVVDTVIYPKLAADQAWARLPDGADTWDYTDEPTPGANNR